MLEPGSPNAPLLSLYSLRSYRKAARPAFSPSLNSTHVRTAPANRLHDECLQQLPQRDRPRRISRNGGDDIISQIAERLADCTEQKWSDDDASACASIAPAGSQRGCWHCAGSYRRPLRQPALVRSVINTKFMAERRRNEVVADVRMFDGKPAKICVWFEWIAGVRWTGHWRISLPGGGCELRRGEWRRCRCYPAGIPSNQAWLVW